MTGNRLGSPGVLRASHCRGVFPVELDIADVGLRLGSAALAGAIIGLNRDLAQKPIGVRTLGLVALGASTVTVATISVPGMMEHADAMSRVVQGLIQGIM